MTARRHPPPIRWFPRVRPSRVTIAVRSAMAAGTRTGSEWGARTVVGQHDLVLQRPVRIRKRVKAGLQAGRPSVGMTTT
jgi:hypothetical protein